MCAGADAAITFYLLHGVSTEEQIWIDVVDQLPSGITKSAVGCFSPAEKRSYVLSYQVFAGRKTWLGLPINRRLYESVAIHEVAHALASCSAVQQPLTTEATEYLAFVTMFSTMDDGVLREVLMAYPGETFESHWDVNEFVYGLNPVRFGVMAYRHYMKLPDRSAFVREILAGSVLGRRYYY